MADSINWGSVADWAAAFASAGASLVALYLAREANRIKWQGSAGINVIVGGGKHSPDLVNVRVTNVGARPINVQMVSIRCGLFKKRYGFIPVWDPLISSAIPTALADGQSAQWSIALDEKPDWIEQLCRGDEPFVRSRLDVITFRFEVHASTGTVLALRPRRTMRHRLWKAFQPETAAK